ncbi:secretoglobin family 3A member 1 [Sorex fumeus]|uniref:secretoglobin family 3A member 1 n=1 Tax=Sorex fumeus TaxID=62283 RepID=UPI0024AE7949|nr:secretoglobin family 3A member 1 [Sorex fumeus]
MKPFVSAAILAACVALLGHSVTASFLPSKLNPVQAVVAVPKGVGNLASPAAMTKVVGNLASPLLHRLNSLRFLLSLAGIPVEHLVEGTQKCVAELGPEAIESVMALKKLLGVLTFIG